MLKAEQLSKSYRTGSRTVEVFHQVDAEFPSGTFCTIQGVSGCGKSTLLHLLGGLDAPSSGRVFYRGEEITGWSRTKMASWRNQKAGFVFQFYHLVQELTALENVEIPAMIGGRQDRSGAERLLESVGLTHRAEHLPGELSGGEQQRVAIARALRNDPEILLADEPTGNLDPQTAAGVLDLILEIQKTRKMTLVLVTHDPKIGSMGEIQYRFESGRLVCDFPR